MSTIEILDIVGGIFWLITFIGLVFPRVKALSQTNITINLLSVNK
ncbi:MAG: hypothetical protein WCS83_06535 [Endomicrobiia bacterium]|jgi:hypothetical protein